MSLETILLVPFFIYPQTIYKNIELVEEALSAEMVIPDTIKFLITNSKNKEGININTSPDLLVIEHHYVDDIIQICGRFRNGVELVHVLYDAQQFRLLIPYEREEEYQREQGIVAANNYLSQLIKEHKDDLSIHTVFHEQELCDFIRYIHKMTPYLRCNPFSGRFEMNECYIQARADYQTKISSFKRLMEEWNNDEVSAVFDQFSDGVM